MGNPAGAPPPGAYPPAGSYPPPGAYPPQPSPVHAPQVYPPAAIYPPQQSPMHVPEAYPPPGMPVAYPPPAQVEKPPPVPVSYPQQASPVPVSYPQQAPVAAGMALQAIGEPWSTGLFDCMDDPSNAIITALLPCITFGQISEIIDEGRTTCGSNGFMYGCILCLIAMPCLISCGYRTRLRVKYNLMEAPAPDWATHCIFEWCALCQEYRELRNRGLDPEIGWLGNVAKHQGTAMAAPTNQRMVG